METLHALQDSVTDACARREALDSSRRFFSFLRLIFVQIDGMPPVKAKISEFAQLSVEETAQSIMRRTSSQKCCCMVVPLGMM